MKPTAPSKVKQEIEEKEGAAGGEAGSDTPFMINLSPVLRRAQTTFVNFDSGAP